MTATNNPPMPSPRAELTRRTRAVRWLWSTTLLAFAPKCLVCLWSYAGVGAALGFGGQEMCGAPERLLEGWQAWLAFGVFATGAGVLLTAHRRHRALARAR